jgi:antitoxin VapB
MWVSTLQALRMLKRTARDGLGGFDLSAVLKKALLFNEHFEEPVVRTTAKVFTNGHFQYIRLPKAIRVNADEMWVEKNGLTGEITLKPKDSETLRQRHLDALVAAISGQPLPDSFLSDASRQNKPPENLFQDWDHTLAPQALARRTVKAKVRT